MGRYLTPIEIPTKTDSVITEVTTSDDDAMEALNDILYELKIMNMHFALLTDAEIQKENV